MRERAGALNSEARVIAVRHLEHYSYDAWRRVARTDPQFCQIAFWPFALLHALQVEARASRTIAFTIANDCIDHYK